MFSSCGVHAGSDDKEFLFIVYYFSLVKGVHSPRAGNLSVLQQILAKWKGNILSLIKDKMRPRRKLKSH